jgi:hypothetical protein
VNAEWLSRHFRENPSEIAAVVERYRARWRVQSWTCEASQKTGESDLLGPGGFSFRFPGQLVSVYHLIPFSVFASDPDARDQLRRVWSLIATLLGSSRALYTHELMPYEGATLRQIEEGLRVRIGPPAENFDELAQAEYYGPRAWYIDDFTDLGSGNRIVDRG